jgi:PTS system galactitol-specific IIA component
MILCRARLPARSADHAVSELAKALAAAGIVGMTFEAAALAREKRSPTGLPFPEIAVAIPHAEPEHVLAPGLALATLAKPVAFRQMGAPATKLSVSIVVMPALTAKEQAAAGLSSLIERLQDDGVRRALVAAQTDDDLAQLVAAWEVRG